MVCSYDNTPSRSAASRPDESLERDDATLGAVDCELGNPLPLEAKAIKERTLPELLNTVNWGQVDSLIVAFRSTIDFALHGSVQYEVSAVYLQLLLWFRSATNLHLKRV